MRTRKRQTETAMNLRERRMRGFLVCLALAGWMVLSVSGCATTDEGDIPWNAPQPWEGAPVIPGMNN